MKKRILFIIIFFIIGLLFVLFITRKKVNTWVYDLPNNYEIVKKSETEVILESDNIKITDYIAEFAYSESYVVLRCFISETSSIRYYIIDTKNNIKYGPYDDLSTYESVYDTIVDEELGIWVETIYEQ